MPQKLLPPLLLAHPVTALIRDEVTRQDAQRVGTVIVTHGHAAAEFTPVPHESVHEPFDDETGHAVRGHLFALEEDADATNEPEQVASADDVFAFKEEFEVREGGVGGVGREERAGGGSAAVGGDEGGVEFGEDVGGVDGCEGALGGALAV